MDQVEAIPVERINLLGIPVDNPPKELLIPVLLDILKNKGGGNIVLLSLWDLLRARRNREYRQYLMNAALILPISKSLIGGAKFLTGKTLARYMPFDFAVELLSFLEERESSLYLLGGTKKTLKKVERNFKLTFPRLQIVGRHIGAIRRQEEAPLTIALRKAAPTLLLVGEGTPGKEKWIARHYDKLNPGIRLWCSDLLEVFALRKGRPSRAMFDRGLEWMGSYLQKPLKYFRIFPYLYYKFLLLSYRLRGKGNRPLKPINL